MISVYSAEKHNNYHIQFRSFILIYHTKLNHFKFKNKKITNSNVIKIKYKNSIHTNFYESMVLLI